MRHIAVVLLVIAFPSVRGQAQTLQFLPEVDAYLKLHPQIQGYLQAKQTREGGDPTQVDQAWSSISNLG